MVWTLLTVTVIFNAPDLVLEVGLTGYAIWSENAAIGIFGICTFAQNIEIHMSHKTIVCIVSYHMHGY